MGKSLEKGGETVLRFSRESASICFIEGPGMGERWMEMDSWDRPCRRTPTPQLFGSRCLLLGSTSKGEMWKNLSVSYFRSRKSLGVLFFPKIDRKSLIMCLQSHCGFTERKQIFLKLCSLHKRECLGNKY